MHMMIVVAAVQVGFVEEDSIVFLQLRIVKPYSEDSSISGCGHSIVIRS